MRFWQGHLISLDTNFKGFKRDEEPKIKEELYDIEELLSFFSKRLPDFKNNEVVKQVFLINLVNALFLYNLAVLALVQPQALQLLKSFSYL
mmetsp:Transcript_21039/g.15417  ORF Transcript_21039/g.15417 Transcript_21039/m.15417 type:complete len:91 (-) Transcript_21039:605-877(-)